MEIGDIIPHIEALIFASDKPLTAMELTELANNAFGFMDEKLTLEQIQTAIDGIVEKYRSEFYPFEVRESGGGLQFLTKKEYHKTVAQLNGEKFLKRLSTAALETLSIIAYKQPVTKGEIESIRGVSSDYAIQRLLEKELVVITGRNEKMPGHPLVYATSRSFMDYFGINSPEDLPKLKEVFDEALVNPTYIENMRQSPDAEDAEQETETTDNNELLAVTRAGELTTAKIKKDKEEKAAGNRTSEDQVVEESFANDNAEDNINEDETLGEDPIDNDVAEKDFSEENLSENDLIKNESEDDLVEEEVIEEDLVEEEVAEEDVVEEDVVEEDPDEEDLIEGDVAEEDVVEEDVAEEDVVEEDVVEEDLIEEDVVEEDLDEEYLNEDGSVEGVSAEEDTVKESDASDEASDQKSGGQESDDNDQSDNNNADTNKGKTRNQD